jgi:prepilin-type N-terminal cleavage/methylation domain-containing protein
MNVHTFNIEVQRGYSLIELMIVLIILGIMMSAVVAGYGTKLHLVRSARIGWATVTAAPFRQALPVTRRQLACWGAVAGRSLPLLAGLDIERGVVPFVSATLDSNRYQI